MLGEHLRKLREARDMSLQQVQINCGVNGSFLSQVERGNKKPSPTTLKKLATAYRVDYQDLLKAANYLPEVLEESPTETKRRRLEKIVTDLRAQLVEIEEELKNM
jgi:transcriptional regulator with XRE-family HTH domain